jgi:hypothetical protein
MNCVENKALLISNTTKKGSLNNLFIALSEGCPIEETLVDTLEMFNGLLDLSDALCLGPGADERGDAREGLSELDVHVQVKEQFDVNHGILWYFFTGI